MKCAIQNFVLSDFDQIIVPSFYFESDAWGRNSNQIWMQKFGLQKEGFRVVLNNFLKSCSFNVLKRLCYLWKTNHVEASAWEIRLFLPFLLTVSPSSTFDIVPEELLILWGLREISLQITFSHSLSKHFYK